MALLGVNSKFYYNSSSYGSPTWVEVNQVSDLNVNDEWDQADANARDSLVKRQVNTLMGLEVSGMLKVKLDDTAYNYLADALVFGTTIDVLVMEAAVTVVGARGYRYDAQVRKGSQDQGLQSALYKSITVSPTCSTNPPKAVKVGPGPALQYAIPGTSGGSYS